mgnify:CR=1 FL=1
MSSNRWRVVLDTGEVCEVVLGGDTVSKYAELLYTAIEFTGTAATFDFTPDDNGDGIAKIINDHLKEHYLKWSQTPQDMAALLGWKVPPPPPIPPPGAGGPPPPEVGPADGPKPPPKDGPPPDGPGAGGRAMSQGQPIPGGPRMPINPLTNERAPAGPGLPPTPTS